MLKMLLSQKIKMAAELFKPLSIFDQCRAIFGLKNMKLIIECTKKLGFWQKQ
jgi:hypothetical protein